MPTYPRIDFKGYNKLDAISFTKELPSERSIDGARWSRVLHQTMQDFTLDYLDLIYDSVAIGQGGGTPTVEVVKLPATVSVDDYIVNSALGTELVAAFSVATSAKTHRKLDLSGKTEGARRFTRGERLVVIGRNFSSSVTETSGGSGGTGSGPSGANAAIGFESAAMSGLGRKDRL